MTRRLRPGARSAVGAFLLAALLTAATGCGAGFGAATSQPYTPSDGVNGEAGDVLLRSIAVVTPGPGGPAAVVGGLVNEGGGTDRLVGVQVLGSDEPGYIAEREIALPRGVLVPLGIENAPSVTVTGPPERLQAGNFVKMRFVFERAGATTLQVLVQPQKGDYATITPVPSPTGE